MRDTAWYRRTGLLIAGLMVVLVLFGCDRPGRAGEAGDSVTEAQAQQAFMVAFGGAYVGSMAAQFGQPLPGLSIDMENQTVVFDEFDVSELDTDYRTISGTVKSSADAAEVDFVMTGGPVRSIVFRVGAEQMAETDGFRTKVTVNGREMDIAIDAEMQ